VQILPGSLFSIGRNALPIFGISLNMATRSPLIARLLTKYASTGIPSKTSPVGFTYTAPLAIPLREDVLLTTENATAFVHVWLYLNGLFDTFITNAPLGWDDESKSGPINWPMLFKGKRFAGTCKAIKKEVISEDTAVTIPEEKKLYSLKDLLEILNWFKYFEVNFGTELYDTSPRHLTINEQVYDAIANHIVSEAFNSISQGKKFDALELSLLSTEVQGWGEKIYEQTLNLDQEGVSVETRQEILTLAELIGVRFSPQVQEVLEVVDILLGFVDWKANEGDTKLSPKEKKWLINKLKVIPDDQGGLTLSSIKKGGWGSRLFKYVTNLIVIKRYNSVIQLTVDKSSKPKVGVDFLYKLTESLDE
jgi:hypothetical protein